MVKVLLFIKAYKKKYCCMYFRLKAKHSFSVHRFRQQFRNNEIYLRMERMHRNRIKNV